MTLLQSRSRLLTAAVLLVLPPMFLPAQDTSSQETTRQIQMVQAKAYLTKTLDAKKAKQGDPLMARLQEDVKIPDAQELPTNTLLVGHIDQVQVSEKKSDSSIQVTFDKAQLKNGSQVPLKATIMQIRPPMNGNPYQQEGEAPVGPTMPSGGGGRGMAPTPGSSAPEPSGSADQAQPGVEGVTLQSDIHQSYSGTFLAKGKNVHLSSGTQMQFALAVVPPNTAIQ